MYRFTTLLTVASFLTYFVLCCHAADWLDVEQDVKKLKEKSPDLTGKDVKTEIEKETGDDMVDVESATLEDGSMAKKIKQKYCGLKIYNSQMTVVEDPTTHKIKQTSGRILNHLNEDLKCDDLKLTLNEKEAEGIVKAYVKKTYREFSDKKVTFEFEHKEKMIGIDDEDSHGTVLYLIGVDVWNVDTNEEASLMFKMEAFSGTILDHWNNFQSYFIDSKGGNERTPIYYDKQRQGQLDVPKDDETCKMETTQFRVIDYRSKYPRPAFSFTCDDDIKDTVNGGYSPLSDGFYFTQKIYGMWKELIDMDIFSKAPAPFNVFVHYGSSYVNAFYSPSSGNIFIGDAYGFYYPLTTCAVIAHEMAHRFTHEQSGLEYSKVAGGLNEAYADLVGITANNYVYGKYDFNIGDKAFKKSGNKFRNMCNQAEDWYSIIHTRDYTTSMDPHYVSGIFNRVSCLLVQYGSYDINKVFKLYTYANRMHWTPQLTFAQFACQTKAAATELKYNVEDLNKAFNDVGIPNCQK